MSAGPKPQAGDALEELSRTVLDLVIDHPFFGHLAGGMTRILDPEQPWPLGLRIDEARYTLSISPRRFLALRPRQRAVAMEHELLHAVLAHPTRAVAHLGAAPHPETAALFGVACDLVVNQLLSAGPPMPGAVTLALLPAEQQVPGLTAEEYFTLLKRLYARGLLPGLHLCLGPNCRGSKCRGPASGHPWGGASLSAAQLAQAGFEPLVRETALRCSSKEFGRLPAGLRSAVRVILDAYEATLDWRRVLRMFSASSRRSRVRATLRRPSRRYHTFPGIRIARGQRLAVCVDTSGSIDSKTLAVFFAEVHQIWRAGAEVVVFEVDAEVHRTWQYRGTPPTIATGRGGTCFEPGLRAVREAVPRFDACVYLTDGEGPKPDTEPCIPLLWLVTPDGTMGSHLAYGQSVRIGSQGSLVQPTTRPSGVSIMT